MKQFTNGKYTCKLGQSAKENWKLFDEANPYHYFFHLSFYPSGYVILETDEEIDETVVLWASEICRMGTKYRNLKNLKVDYCRCDNLIKGFREGEIVFRSLKKIKHIII